VWDTDRQHATQRMLRALAEYEIDGLTTLLPFHRALLATEQWAKAETCRDLLEDRGRLQSKELYAMRIATEALAVRATVPRLRPEELAALAATSRRWTGSPSSTSPCALPRVDIAGNPPAWRPARIVGDSACGVGSVREPMTARDIEVLAPGLGTTGTARTGWTTATSSLT
jgi:Biotin carboxylase C-terminal domain